MNELSERVVQAEKVLQEMKTQALSKSTRIVIPRERKIRPFNGSDGESLDEFLDEVEEVISARNMLDQEAVEFMLTHLEGQAKEEVKLYPKRQPRINFQDTRRGIWRKKIVTSDTKSILRQETATWRKPNAFFTLTS